MICQSIFENLTIWNKKYIIKLCKEPKGSYQKAKERYIQFRSDVEAAKRKLQGASTSEDIDEAIIELASLMKQSFEDSLLDEMIVWIADARLKACNLRMHDYTRKEMVKLLEDMLKSLDSIIEAANKNTRNFQDWRHHQEEF